MDARGIDSIVARLRTGEDYVPLDGATTLQIAEFEEKHDLRLPELYKRWLGHSDGGELYPPAGVQFYGVAHKPVIDVNNDDRPDDSYIVIGALATGDPILCERQSERISIYNHEAGRIEDDETYKDLSSFLSDLPEILGIEE